jgi:hypothetical protein
VVEDKEVEDTFGRVDGGALSIQRGWLTEEMVIQFKMRAGGLAVWKRKYAAHRLWLKMTPLDQDLKISQVNLTCHITLCPVMGIVKLKFN